MEQLDKLEHYTTPITEGASSSEGELGELSLKFYQAAVQVCVSVCVETCQPMLTCKNGNEMDRITAK